MIKSILKLSIATVLLLRAAIVGMGGDDGVSALARDRGDVGQRSSPVRVTIPPLTAEVSGESGLEEMSLTPGGDIFEKCKCSRYQKCLPCRIALLASDIEALRDEKTQVDDDIFRLTTELEALDPERDRADSASLKKGSEATDANAAQAKAYELEQLKERLTKTEKKIGEWQALWAIWDTTQQSWEAKAAAKQAPSLGLLLDKNVAELPETQATLNLTVASAGTASSVPAAAAVLSSAVAADVGDGEGDHDKDDTATGILSEATTKAMLSLVRTRT